MHSFFYSALLFAATLHARAFTPQDSPCSNLTQFYLAGAPGTHYEAGLKAIDFYTQIRFNKKQAKRFPAIQFHLNETGNLGCTNPDGPGDIYAEVYFSEGVYDIGPRYVYLYNRPTRYGTHVSYLTCAVDASTCALSCSVVVTTGANDTHVPPEDRVTWRNLYFLGQNLAMGGKNVSHAVESSPGKIVAVPI